MNFTINQSLHGPGRVALYIVANYTPEESAALTELRAWEQICISYFSATFRSLIEPGFKVESSAPVYADHFQARFPSTYGWEAQQRLAPILQSFRHIVHTELEDQRDAHFGLVRLPPYRKLLP